MKTRIKTILAILAMLSLSAHAEASRKWRVQVGPSISGETSVRYSLSRTIYTSNSFSLEVTSGYQTVYRYGVVPVEISPRYSFGSRVSSFKPYISGSVGFGHAFEQHVLPGPGQPFTSELIYGEIVGESAIDRSPSPRRGNKFRILLSSGFELPLSSRFDGLFEIGVIGQDMGTLQLYAPNRKSLNLPTNTDPQEDSRGQRGLHTSFYFSVGVAL